MTPTSDPWIEAAVIADTPGPSSSPPDPPPLRTVRARPVWYIPAAMVPGDAK